MKKVEIRLDDNSLEILGKVESIHRESLINLGIRLVKDTSFYKLLTGEAESIEEVEKLDVVETKQEEKQETESEDLGISW